MFLIFMPDNCILNEISKLPEMGAQLPAIIDRCPHLCHWVQLHKSCFCNEAEKCHPASELMKRGGRPAHLTHFSFKCTLKMSDRGFALKREG